MTVTWTRQSCDSFSGMSSHFHKFRAILKAGALRKIQFQIHPASKQSPVKLTNLETIKRLPKPTDQIVENPGQQEHVRKQAKRIQKKISMMQLKSKRRNEFRKVTDYPDDLM